MPAIRCTVSPPDQSRRVPFGYSEPLKQNLGLGAHYAVVDLFERVMSPTWRTPGSHVITDGWTGYPSATRDRYKHTGTSVSASGLAAHDVLLGVHRTFSLVKRWLLGTMQGSVTPEHMQAYLDEWVFRFNRRNARSRGLIFHTLLQHSVEGKPMTYNSMRKTGRTRPRPQPIQGVRETPPSLDVGHPELPWRNQKSPPSEPKSRVPT